MNKRIKLALVTIGFLAATSAKSEITFYENDEFQGRTFTANEEIRNFQQFGFNDRASSAIVMRDRWEVCEDVQFGGRCIVLRPGRYSSLSSMSLNNRISSVRIVGYSDRVDDDRYAPPPYPIYDNRRRNNERIYTANVTSVRAVLGASERRCWVERERVGESQNNNNVPGAVIGAVIGGILGHQVGGGSGKDIATAIGAATGAVVGNKSGGNDQNRRTYTQNVRRCENDVSSAKPEYWDVTYFYRGQEHRVQMSYPPGPTISVNRRGEPR